jgi:flagellar biosynthesis protein FlhF
MDVRVYRAATMSEALTKVKADLGHSALILHTRQIVERYCLGLRRREIVEITAARNAAARRQQVAPRPLGRAAVAPSGDLAGPRKSGLPLNGYSTLSRISIPAATARPLLETAAASNIIFLDLSKQMESLRTMVKDLSVQVQHHATPHVPAELTEYFGRLTGRQVCPALAAEMLKDLHREIRPEHLQREDFVTEKLLEQIERHFTVTGPISRTKSHGPHVIALVGPTGVGKTTTIAKLAANLMLREKRRVGLITIDTYRIAAIEQLRKYAQIIGANLRVVASADELGGAIDSLSDSEYVLIDTAGRSPNDTLKLGELRNFISLARADEVHLVLSATASQECAEHAIECFSDVRIDKLIFTKLDETRQLGSVLNVVKKVNKPVSYVTTGQDVPDDIEVARGRRLAQLILGCEL